MPETANASTCAAIAQIMPVFLVALIAERVVFGKANDPGQRRRSVLAGMIRLLVDLTLACGLVFTTLFALFGIESGGIAGRGAEMLWWLSALLLVGVVYRWLLLATPLLGLIDDAAQAWAAALVSVVEGMAEIPVWMARGLQLFVEVVAGVLSAGLGSGVQALADFVARRKR